MTYRSGGPPCHLPCELPRNLGSSDLAEFLVVVDVPDVLLNVLGRAAEEGRDAANRRPDGIVWAVNLNGYATSIAIEGNGGDGGVVSHGHIALRGDTWPSYTISVFRCQYPHQFWLFGWPRAPIVTRRHWLPLSTRRMSSRHAISPARATSANLRQAAPAALPPPAGTDRAPPPGCRRSRRRGWRAGAGCWRPPGCRPSAR